MPGWLRRAAAWASRMTRSAFSPSTDLTATQRQRRSSQARWTVPWPPPPILSPIVNRPSTRSPSTTATRFAAFAIRASCAGPGHVRRPACTAADPERASRPGQGSYWRWRKARKPWTSSTRTTHTSLPRRGIERTGDAPGARLRRAATIRMADRAGEQAAGTGPPGGAPARRDRLPDPDRDRLPRLPRRPQGPLVPELRQRSQLDHRRDRAAQHELLRPAREQGHRLGRRHRLRGRGQRRQGNRRRRCSTAPRASTPPTTSRAPRSRSSSPSSSATTRSRASPRNSPALSAGGKDADKAGKAIYTQMKVLSASDILYARAQDQIEQALTDNDVVVDEGVPDSQFLPDEPDYLDPAVTAAALGGVATSSGDDRQRRGLQGRRRDPRPRPRRRQHAAAAVGDRARQRRQRHRDGGRQRDRGRRPEPGHRRREQHQRRRLQRQRHLRVRDDRPDRRRRDPDGEDPAAARRRRPATA